MNYEEVTIEDCIQNYDLKEKAVILNNGQVTCFVEEKKEKGRTNQ